MTTSKESDGDRIDRLAARIRELAAKDIEMKVFGASTYCDFYSWYDHWLTDSLSSVS